MAASVTVHYRGELTVRDCETDGVTIIRSDDDNLCIYERDRLLQAVAEYVLDNDEAGRCFFHYFSSRSQQLQSRATCND